MTATDELRKLLDERGIIYKTDTFVIDADHGKEKETAWVIGDSRYVFHEYQGRTVLTCTPITPEQAIAATLESNERTCHNTSHRLDESRFHCSECEFGCWVKDVADGRDKLPNYCPNCGAKVVNK